MAKNKDIDPLYIIGMVLGTIGAIFAFCFQVLPGLGSLLLGGGVLVANPSFENSFSSALSSVDAQVSKNEQGSGYRAPTMAPVASTELPKDFAVPIYTGATTLSSSPQPDGDIVILRTPTPADQVIAFYRREFTSAGWTIHEQADIMTASKDSRHASIRFASTVVGSTDIEIKSRHQ